MHSVSVSFAHGVMTTSLEGTEMAPIDLFFPFANTNSHLLHSLVAQQHIFPRVHVVYNLEGHGGGKMDVS